MLKNYLTFDMRERETLKKRKIPSSLSNSTPSKAGPERAGSEE